MTVIRVREVIRIAQEGMLCFSGKSETFQWSELTITQVTRGISGQMKLF